MPLVKRIEILDFTDGLWRGKYFHWWTECCECGASIPWVGNKVAYRKCIKCPHHLFLCCRSGTDRMLSHGKWLSVPDDELGTRPYCQGIEVWEEEEGEENDGGENTSEALAPTSLDIARAERAVLEEGLNPSSKDEKDAMAFIGRWLSTFELPSNVASASGPSSQTKENEMAAEVSLARISTLRDMVKQTLNLSPQEEGELASAASILIGMKE
jgi:hypothetical protein